LEAIILAGGKAERLGDASKGLPKPLVEIEGRPLAAYQVALLSRAGVDRVIVSCASGTGDLFMRELMGLVPEVVVAEEEERLGRGGGIRFAATFRKEQGDVFALNGDELLDVDFRAMLERHRESAAAATIAVAQPPSPFGVADIDEEDVITGFREAGRIPYWVNCGVYVLGPEALERFPERGDHETTAFPELAAERKLRAFRHQRLWLTVNTPKELRRAREYIREHPEWLSA
jgi:NDP-sugar pyrophosphorylase family protein